jgi:hypothetical protein
MAKPSDGTAHAAGYIPIQTLKWSNPTNPILLSPGILPLTLQPRYKSCSILTSGFIRQPYAFTAVNAFNKSDY